MGCNRDNISPRDFVANIAKEETGAIIDIIIYEECLNQILRNGLSYVDFVKTLHHSFSQSFPKKTLEPLDQSASILSMIESPPLQP